MIIGAKRIYSFVKIMDLEPVPQAYICSIKRSVLKSTEAGDVNQHTPATTSSENHGSENRVMGTTEMGSPRLLDPMPSVSAAVSSMVADSELDSGCIQRRLRPASVSCWLVGAGGNATGLPHQTPATVSISDKPQPSLPSLPAESCGGPVTSDWESQSSQRPKLKGAGRQMPSSVVAGGGLQPVNRTSSSLHKDESMPQSEQSLAKSRQATQQLMKDVQQMELQLKQMRGI